MAMTQVRESIPLDMGVKMTKTDKILLQREIEKLIVLVNKERVS
ncbi:hypothetical protein [Pseudolactococcus insecticola]|uniref:Uncharacterized protein n=1 Tax=Pseudolactococcus insecticola TaxID=2709158 RepID=A0A6A0B486_9LACT|nr:hypothetical protein [Lactococcus insecticola]GFH40130.1 hypothetical protein Hs20B_05280 [Lactococcus insecticola]